jgi:hypothetical protein
MHLKDEWFDLLWEEEEEKAKLENALYLFGRILKISSFFPLTFMLNKAKTYIKTYKKVFF